MFCFVLFQVQRASYEYQEFLKINNFKITNMLVPFAQVNLNVVKLEFNCILKINKKIFCKYNNAVSFCCFNICGFEKHVRISARKHDDQWRVVVHRSHHSGSLLRFACGSHRHNFGYNSCR